MRKTASVALTTFLILVLAFLLLPVRKVFLGRRVYANLADMVWVAPGAPTFSVDMYAEWIEWYHRWERPMRKRDSIFLAHLPRNYAVGSVLNDGKALEASRELLAFVYGEYALTAELAVAYDPEHATWLVYSILPENMLGGSMYALFTVSGEIVAIYATK